MNYLKTIEKFVNKPTFGRKFVDYKIALNIRQAILKQDKNHIWKELFVTTCSGTHI